MGNWVSNNSSLDNSWSILRNSLIGHILNNSISVVSIVDSLDSSIRKSNRGASRSSSSHSYQGRYKKSLHFYVCVLQE